MKITDEQIEKAAKAAYESRMQNLHMPSNWDRQHEWDRIVERRAVRAALEAVMPEKSPSSASRWEAREIAREMLADLRNEGVSAAHIRDYADMVADALLRRFNHDHPAPEPGELERLLAENELLRKDAERYRALRDGSLDDLAVVRGLGVIDYGLNVVLYTYLKEIEGDEMDNAIDAARRALAEEGGGE